MPKHLPTQKIVSAKEKANLIAKPNDGNGGGRPKKDKEVQAVARKLVTDAAYRQSLYRRLREGTIQPGMEALLWYYAWGKPKEVVENRNLTAVKIVFEMPADAPKPVKALETGVIDVKPDE